MKHIIILLLITLQVNAQERYAWWRPILAYNKDSALDTAKTIKNILARHNELWGDTLKEVPAGYIGSLVTKQQANKITKYKKGFQYTENRSGITVLFKLLEWIPVGTDLDGLVSYRWRVKGYIPLIKKSFLEYTDDCWIDVDIGIAYVDPCEHKIKYYDQKQ